MCIGAPMRIAEVDGAVARATTLDGAVEAPVSLALTGALPVGAFVLVHCGSAVRRLREAEACAIGDALEAAALALEGAPFDHLLGDLAGRTPELPAHLRPRQDASGETGR